MNSTYEALKSILAPYSQHLDVKQSKPGNITLDTRFVLKGNKPLYFGGVVAKKNYVSFHLMPIHLNPDLLKDISPELKKRKQGKYSFNFREKNDELFQELTDLTQRAYLDFQKKGYIKK